MNHFTNTAGESSSKQRDSAWTERGREILRQLPMSTSMDHALRLLAAGLCECLAVDAAAVCLIQPHTGRVEVMQDIGHLAPVIQVLLAAGVGQAWYGLANASGTPLRVHESQLFAEWKPLFEERHLRYVTLVPLVSCGCPYGCVVAAWQSEPEPERLSWLENLCAAFAGHFWAMQEGMRADSTKIQSLATLGIALESRDGETFGHTQRVVRWMKRFMNAAGIKDPDRECGIIGAYLHDIGKISIPDHILRKPGPLTPEERRLIERHTVYGYELARRLSFVQPPALEVILHHHERWDGTGYPHGLRGSDIPLLARMFAIIDVYDALIHPRPYKDAWTPSEAQAYLIAMRGAQFDPELTDLYLSLIRKERPVA
jgi:putative nucleotidyltransferase with HDIG domain